MEVGRRDKLSFKRTDVENMEEGWRNINADLSCFSDTFAIILKEQSLCRNVVNPIIPKEFTPMF